jgi:hypothetical protein
MSDILSKRIRLQAVKNSSPQKAANKNTLRPLSRKTKQGSSISLTNPKEGKSVKIKNKEKGMIPTVLAKSKINTTCKQAASRERGKGTKKSAPAKLVILSTDDKTARTKAAKPLSTNKLASVKEEHQARSPQKKKSLSAPRLASASRKRSVHRALALFEQAVKSFNQRDFSGAKEIFEGLQQRYPAEVDIFARAQIYIQVCELRLSKMAATSAPPKTADELYDCGVIALNTGNFAQALAMFEKALSLRPDDSHILYSIAATYAQSGYSEQALRYLQSAVQKQPRFRQRALSDSEFSNLHADKRFLELTGIASPFDRLEMRRSPI